jgi:NAD(P)H-dependent flavin oxidoreductase YrpB (nitropropane dioxygenase family)
MKVARALPIMQAPIGPATTPELVIAVAGCRRPGDSRRLLD